MLLGVRCVLLGRGVLRWPGVSRGLTMHCAEGLGRVGAYHAVQKWLAQRVPSRVKQHVYLWYERAEST